MGLLDWMKRRDGGQRTEPDRQAIPNYGPNEIAFRFQKPFAHLEYFMSPEEKKVVNGIEARWKENYETFKNYPAMSENQDHDIRVFRAVDDAYKALDAREQAPFKDWKRLEADMDKAIGRVREAFTDQRKCLERDLGEAREHEKQMAPDYRKEHPGRSWDR
jgi:hypothetical protein